MRRKLQSKNYGKLFLIGVSFLTWVLILLLFKTTGVNLTWRFWNVPTSNVSFLDFRLIPGSAESFKKGYEPSVENPFDPGQRIFNYPAFWRLFFYTQIEEDDTVWISIIMIILFFISVFIFPEKLSIAGAAAMLLVLFSPASMLLYERANVDLIVFVICVLIVLAESRSAYPATGLIMLGSI